MTFLLFRSNHLNFLQRIRGISEIVCRNSSFITTDVVLTQDLAERTNFSTNAEGMYDIPHAPVKDAAYGPNLRPLNVILVPHSHVDPGWLQTMDNYYKQRVKFILDNLVRKLVAYPDMTFIWAEIIFLKRWWKDQSDSIRKQMNDLVKSGIF